MLVHLSSYTTSSDWAITVFYTIITWNPAYTVVLALLIEFMSSSKAFHLLFINIDRLKLKQINDEELHISWMNLLILWLLDFLLRNNLASEFISLVLLCTKLALRTIIVKDLLWQPLVKTTNRLLRLKDHKVGQEEKSCIRFTQENSIESSVQDRLSYILDYDGLCYYFSSLP